jgi:hypothetical protein
MALAYDTKERIPATALTTTTGAPTANYTCGANAGVLVVMLCWAGTTARTGGAPTYNGVALTQAGTQKTVTETSVEMWYLLSPPTGSALSLVVPNDGGMTMWVYVASATAAAGSTCAFDAVGEAATTGSSPTVSVTAVAAATIIFAVVASGDNTFAPTARTGTSLYEEDIANYGGAGQYYVKSGSGSQAMSWTESTSDDYGAIAVAFKEVAGAKIFAGTAQMTSATPSVSMAVTRLLAGVADLTSLTPNAASSIIRLLNIGINDYWAVAGVTKPQHYWPFAQTQNYTDQGSAGGLDLTAQGSGNSFTANGLVLNGSGWAKTSLGSSDLGDLGNTFSLLWDMQEFTNTNNAIFISVYDSASPYCPVVGNDNCIFYIQSGGWKYIQSTAGSIPHASRNHVIFTYAGGIGTFYVNGSFVNSAALDALTGNSSIPFSVGASSLGLQKLAGTFRSVGVLKGTAWSADDVADIYAASPPASSDFVLAAMQTATPDDADLLIEVLRIFAGTAEMQTATPAAVMAVTRILAGIADVQSVTPVAAMAVTRVLSGVAQLVSLTPDDVDLTVDVLAKIFVGAAAMQTTTPAAGLQIARLMAGAAGLTTLTPSANMVVTRILSGLAGIASLTPDDAELSISGLIILAGIAAMQSNTPAAPLVVTRKLAGIADLQSSTPSSVLAITRKLVGVAGLQTSTSSPILAVARRLAGAVDMQTITPSAAIQVLRIMAVVVALQSLTPDNVNLSTGEAEALVDYIISIRRKRRC